MCPLLTVHVNSVIKHITSFPDPTLSSDGQNQTSDSGKCVCVCVLRECLVFSGASTCVIVYTVSDCGPDACWLFDPLTPAHQTAATSTQPLHDVSAAPAGSDDDLMLMACDLQQPQLPAPANVPLQPQLPPPLQAGNQNELWGFGSLQSSLTQLPATGKPADRLLFVPPRAASLLLSFLLSLLGLLSWDFTSASFHTLDLDSVCSAGTSFPSPLSFRKKRGMSPSLL